MIFTISLLTSCKTTKTTENTQTSKEKTEQVRESHQNKEAKTNIFAQIDSVIIEDNDSKFDDSLISEIDGSLISDNIISYDVKKPKAGIQRTIKIYGLHKNIKSSNKIVSKEKVQVKKKGSIKTSTKTKEVKPSSNEIFIGIVIVLICLLMIAGYVCWKIAVQ